MKTLRRLIGMALGLLAGTGAELQAQTNLPMVLQMTCTVRGTTNWTRNLYRSKSVQSRLLTKDIVKLLGTALGTNLTGGTLALPDALSTNVVVIKGTNVLADVSSFFSLGWSDTVEDETFNASTGQDNYKALWRETISFDDGAGNNFLFRGLVAETYAASAADRHGTSKVSETMVLNGSGDGELVGKVAMFSGTITTSGRGTVSN